VAVSCYDLPPIHLEFNGPGSLFIKCLLDKLKKVCYNIRVVKRTTLNQMWRIGVFIMRFFDHTENTIVNLNADDFVDYMLSDFHVMECMVDNLSAVCDYFDKVAKFNKKSLMIPDSLYLDMMIDISDGQQFCFDEDGFEFFAY
jgi:hypothetical protein